MAAIQTTLHRWYKRYGRLRVNLVIWFALIVLLSIAVSQLFLELLMAASGHVPLAARASDLLSIAAIGAGVFAVLWYYVVLPLEGFRRRLRLQLQDSKVDTLSTFAYWNDRRSSQIEAALKVNDELREQFAEQTLRAEAQSARAEAAAAICEGLVSLSTDALLQVDTDGRISDFSVTAAGLLGWHKLEAQGRPFEVIAPLYDQTKNRPLEYPLRNIALVVQESGSMLPRVESALLVTRKNEQQPVIVTAVAQVDASGRTVGAGVRIAPVSDAVLDRALVQATVAAPDISRDPITGLMTRELFDRRFDELQTQARAQNTVHSCIFIRFDGLGTVNDEHGFFAGEQLLWRAAQMLRNEVAAAGDCYRVSTGRFAVLLGLVAPEQAMVIAERFRVAIAAREFAWEDKRFAATICAAVVPLTAECEGRRPLVELAERTLIAAREAGGNVVRVHSDDAAMVQRRKQDRDWADWLLPRLDNGLAHLMSQEFVPLVKTVGRPCLEMYFRVEDDDGVWITPTSFLRAVERRGLTPTMDLWVLRTVLAQLKDQLKLLEDYDSFSINISVHSMLNPDFANNVFHELVLASVPAERICFELDERSATSYPGPVHAFAKAAKAAGARLALDQCRGALGLEPLRGIPPDLIKIHEGVVRRAVSDPLDRAHLEWLVSASRVLGCKSVACGVEDAATVRMLENIGVDYAQGTMLNKLGPLLV